MTNEPSKPKSKIEWELLHHLARAYLDLQKTRVAMELRSQRMIESHLISNGLAVEEFKNEKETEGGKVKQGRIVKLVESDDEQEQKMIEKKIEMVIKDFKETSDVYKLVIAHKERLHKQERDLLDQSVELFGDSELWKWCNEVKGLGPVAGMTFVGYINPRSYPTINTVWSQLGLTPTSKLTKGQQAKFNPLLKGRFLGVIGQNVIRSSDPYYSAVYRIKKEYYGQRPDLLDRLENKPKGWKAYINRMAVRVLTKLLVSHAYDVLKYDMGVTDKIVIDHRNNIPLKPSDPMKQKDILERYRYNHVVFLEKLKLAWSNDNSEGHEKYFEYLRHGSPTGDVERDLGL